MSRATAVAAACSVGLVAAAAYVVIAGNSVPTATDVAVTTTTRTTTTAASTTTTATTTTPTKPPPPVTEAEARAALDAIGGTWVASDAPAELTAICEGAPIDTVGATPVYTSLMQEDPSSYLDAVVVVFETEAAAQGAYSRLVDAVAACPTSRTATPPPTEGGEPTPFEVEGEASTSIVVAGQPAGLWRQVQTVQEPFAQLRTSIVFAAEANVLVVVSTDGNAATSTVADVDDAAIGIAAGVVERTRAAAG